jgi:hypothetical protein
MFVEKIQLYEQTLYGRTYRKFQNIKKILMKWHLSTVSNFNLLQSYSTMKWKQIWVLWKRFRYIQMRLILYGGLLGSKRGKL